MSNGRNTRQRQVTVLLIGVVLAGVTILLGHFHSTELGVIAGAFLTGAAMLIVGFAQTVRMERRNRIGLMAGAVIALLAGWVISIGQGLERHDREAPQPHSVKRWSQPSGNTNSG